MNLSENNDNAADNSKLLNYVDKIIEITRNAGKNHPIHNTLKDITKSQPELVRERVANYIEHGVMNGKLILSDAYKEKGMAFLLDNKEDVLNRVEKFILSVFYSSKAHRIFSDYRAGIAELSENSDGKQHVSPNNKLSNPLNF